MQRLTPRWLLGVRKRPQPQDSARPSRRMLSAYPFPNTTDGDRVYTMLLAHLAAALVALVKPQFEVGPSRVGKGGIVRDPAARADALAAVSAFLEASGWGVLGHTPSPIAGGLTGSSLAGGDQGFLIAVATGASASRSRRSSRFVTMARFPSASRGHSASGRSQ